MADRAVQEIAKPNARSRRCAAGRRKPPEMVEPTAVAKPTPRRGQSTKPADTSKPNTPTAGAEIKTGSARVKTGGAAIPFGGLAQGGGGAGGVQLDVKNFCCPGIPDADGPADPSELERRTRAPAGSRSSSSRSDATAC